MIQKLNMKKITKETFDNYVDEILLRSLPNEPYARLKYPIEYSKYKRDLSLVREIVYQRLGDSKWFYEFRAEINELIAVTTLANTFVNKVILEEEKLKVELSK